MKPRLRLSILWRTRPAGHRVFSSDDYHYCHRWSCKNLDYVAFGRTPEEAYTAWKASVTP